MLVGVGNRVVALDAFRRNADINVISHAHSDHTQGLRSGAMVLTSYETSKILEAKSSLKIKQIAELPQGIKIEMLDSGHMLGSKQIRITDSESSEAILYSGDYQMNRPYSAGKIVIKEADTLILDSTYPHPEVEFDDSAEVAYAMQKYTNDKLYRGIVLFGAYSAGKAQDIIKILNESGITPVVGDEIGRVSSAYVECGIKLDYASMNDIPDDNFVCVTEFGKLEAMKQKLAETCKRRVFSAVATGFAKIRRFNTDVQFPLSDHADFKQAVEYIEASGAKEVLTVGGGADVFAENLKKQGYNSRRFVPWQRNLAVTPVVE